MMPAVSSVLSTTAATQDGVPGDVIFSKKPIGGATSPFAATNNVGGDLSRTTRLLDHLRDNAEGDSDEIAMPRARGGRFKLEPMKHIHLVLSLREHVTLR